MLNEMKVIIVTGGNGILGKSIISHLISEGYTCINADLSNDNDPSNDIYKVDVTNFGDIDKLIDLVILKYGKIYGLVNSAYPRTNDWGLKFEDIKLDSWRENVDMQLNSVFYICQKVLPFLKEQNHGSIVNISSIYGIVGPDFSVYDNTNMTMPAAYSAIKGAIINFTRYLASYYGNYNVRINCISPGGIYDGENPLFVQNYINKVPLGRMALPNDISPVVSFLLSNHSSYITGHNLVVDGGWTAI